LNVILKLRLCPVTYSTEMNTLNDLYVHLTNYSVNKHCEGYVANEDANSCQGHKWLVNYDIEPSLSLLLFENVCLLQDSAKFVDILSWPWDRC
jgi:hypothetical protein